MAISKSFFGLRRKSAGNFTYSVGYDANGNKQQVTKEKATEVSNPRTYGQASQRSYFAGATRLASILSRISDHAIEGIKFGMPNRANFIKMVQGLADYNTYGYTLVKPYCKKGFEGILFKFGSQVQISHGSLPIQALTPADTDAGYASEEVANVSFTEENIATYGLQLNDIFTAVALATTPDGRMGMANYWQIKLALGALPEGWKLYKVYLESDDTKAAVRYYVDYSLKPSGGCVIMERKSDSLYQRSDAFLTGNAVASTSGQTAADVQSYMDAASTRAWTKGPDYLDGSEL